MKRWTPGLWAGQVLPSPWLPIGVSSGLRPERHSHGLCSGKQVRGLQRCETGPSEDGRRYPEAWSRESVRGPGLQMLDFAPWVLQPEALEPPGPSPLGPAMKAPVFFFPLIYLRNLSFLFPQTSALFPAQSPVCFNAVPFAAVPNALPSLELVLSVVSCCLFLTQPLPPVPFLFWSQVLNPSASYQGPFSFSIFFVCLFKSFPLPLSFPQP